MDALALGLLEMGIGQGDRVGIWAPNCAEWTLTQYATAKIGAILVNINPAYRTRELEFALTRADFDDWIAPLLERTGKACKRALRDAGIEASALDGVILVGGSTRVPRVRSYVQELFGKEPLGDIDPDFLGGVQLGVRKLYLKQGQTEPAPDEWGAISAWAWGLSRAVDYLETDKAVDAKRIAIYGVSRLGKTVMWAGAHDTRIAMVIASCSGEGGAALSRRNYGETIAHLTEPTRFPYQFCANYAKYARHVDQFPVDANMLVALMAPRPVLLQTGDKDYWSDPKGEFLAAVAATPVFHLFGKKGMETDQMPPAGEPIMNTIGYLMHSGGHGTVPTDFDEYRKFIAMHLQK